jgi:hydroxymethylpyrimidine pyrophosphatase-like HAD family hydrolase
MGNADSDVRAKARFVAPSNSEEGFARAVEDLLLPRTGPGT